MAEDVADRSSRVAYGSYSCSSAGTSSPRRPPHFSLHGIAIDAEVNLIRDPIAKSVRSVTAHSCRLTDAVPLA